MSGGTWEKMEERRELKQKINKCCNQQQTTDLSAQYWEVNLEVKKSARQDKRQYVHNLTEEAKTASKQNNIKRVYEITRALSGKSFNPIKPVKNKNGRVITSD